MTAALQTDAELFPFDAEDRAALAAARVALVEVAGHDPDELAAAGGEVDAVFHFLGGLPRPLLERFPRCRVVARVGMGFDSVDVVAARELGMEVVYVPGYGADDVADHALALLLACARRLAAGDEAIRAGRFPSYAELGPMRRLRGSTLGLVGFGRIGRALAGKAAAFGLHVLAHDPLVDVAAAGVEAVSAEELYARSDFVSLHAPLAPETHHLVGERELALMKPTAVLLNTSRGGLVDGAALAAALAAGRLGGAGLDVFEQEPLADDDLRRLDGVVLSPHSASFAEEALADARKRALADVLRVLRGEPPLDPVPA